VSNETSAEIIKATIQKLKEHRAVYLGSGGTEGHILDGSFIGGHKLCATLLLKCAGRKSGKTIITPLVYGYIGGDVVVVASKGGADAHPAWYLNVKDSKEVAFQIATQAYRASWREPVGAERTKIWDYMVGVFPPYQNYQASTQREIPLVMMSAIEAVEIFKPQS
jgi:deazaflavin-dependent oxidoreductase (nitroreductase family)